MIELLFCNLWDPPNLDEDRPKNRNIIIKIYLIKISDYVIIIKPHSNWKIELVLLELKE